MKKKLFQSIVVITMLPCFAWSQNPATSNDSARMDWFAKAKFGIFLHWGVYSKGIGGASWPFFNGQMAQQDYIGQAGSFTAKNYDPEKWASLFKAAGARYAILTAMHCDGVALWPSKANASSVQTLSPYKKDLVGPFCNALKKAGLKAGLYYSHVDWSSTDYMTLTQNITADQLKQDQTMKYNFQKNWDEKSKTGFFSQEKFTAEDQIKWSRFIKRHDNQIDELLNNYKVDLLWFDFMYPNSGDFIWNEKKLYQKITSEHPSLIVNGRLGSYGDYETPERGIPMFAPAGNWELCETMNNDWSYVSSDHANKPVRQLLRMLVECIGMGGNLLLGVGPKADGSIDSAQETRLLEMGKWIAKHQEAVYETQRGLPAGHFYGPTSLSLDRKTLFLYLFDDPKEEIYVRGIKNKVKRLTVVGWPDVSIKPKYFSGADWAGIPPTIVVPINRDKLDDNITVVKIEFNEPIELYRGKGKDIINN